MKILEPIKVRREMRMRLLWIRVRPSSWRRWGQKVETSQEFSCACKKDRKECNLSCSITNKSLSLGSGLEPLLIMGRGINLLEGLLELKLLKGIISKWSCVILHWILHSKRINHLILNHIPLWSISAVLCQLIIIATFQCALKEQWHLN